MTDLQNSYSELLKAVKTFITQDFDPKEWVASDTRDSFLLPTIYK